MSDSCTGAPLGKCSDTGVRVGHGEWDSEYASVVNASLPFEDCAAHVGGEGWGWQGLSFGDLQVRKSP
jgi:hypothetical protein